MSSRLTLGRRVWRRKAGVAVRGAEAGARKSNADAKENEGAIIFTHYINLLENVEIIFFKNLKSTDLAWN